jgi:hypothetical protein
MLYQKIYRFWGVCSSNVHLAEAGPSCAFSSYHGRSGTPRTPIARYLFCLKDGPS